MNLSLHFTLEEMIHSETATRLGLDNEPDETVIANLRTLTVFLERIRQMLGHPLNISSGYRSVAVNAVLGGVGTSAHCKGLAADFLCPGFGSPRDVAKFISESEIVFDQLIYEGTWVHFGISDNMRKEILTADFSSGKAVYSAGIA